MIESLYLGDVNILLQLPSAVLVRKRPPAYKIVSDFFICNWISRNGNIQDTFNFNIVWVKWLFFFYLHSIANIAIVLNYQCNSFLLAKKKTTIFFSVK